MLEPACGPCIGMGQAPAVGAVSVRTFNRNFPGRSGTPGDQVYLCGRQVECQGAEGRRAQALRCRTEGTAHLRESVAQRLPVRALRPEEAR